MPAQSFIFVIQRILNFITEVNLRGITKMKGCAGTFWEVVIDDFVVAGNFQTCRLLSEVGHENNDQSMKLWDNLTSKLFIII